MDDTSRALIDHAERIRHLESLEGGYGAAPSDLEFVLGRASYTADLSAEIPVPRYAYHPDMLPAAPNANDNEGGAAFGTGWINQGTSTITAARSHNILMVPLGSTNVVLRTLAAPATPYTFTASVEEVALYLDFTSAGIALYESSTGKIIFFRIMHSGWYGGQVLAVETFTNFSTYLATPAVFRYPGAHAYLRIQDDGVNLNFSFSPRGYQYVQIYSAGRTTFMVGGPDTVAIGATAAAGSETYGMFDWIRFS